MVGISNIDIETFFKNDPNDGLKQNFVGVYSSNSITRYINFYKVIKERKAPYPFAIFNTDRTDEPGTHWWSFLNFYPKNDLLFFDSFGFKGLRYFIIDNDRSVINKLFYNLNNFNKKDKKVNLISLKFSLSTYKKLKEWEILELRDTAKDFFHLLYEFARLNKVKNELTVVLVDNPLQKLSTDTCGKFQHYFYKNLFDPVRNSKILNHEHLTNKTVEILNKKFSTRQNKNEYRVVDFSKEFNM